MPTIPRLSVLHRLRKLETPAAKEAQETGEEFPEEGSQPLPTLPTRARLLKRDRHDPSETVTRLELTIRVHRARNGKFIAVAPTGDQGSGETKREAINKALAIALRVVARNLKDGEDPRVTYHSTD